MPTENGYSSQKAFGQPQYKTVHNVGSDKFATNVITKGLIERSTDPLVIEAVSQVEISQGLKKQPAIQITITAHGAKRAGEVLRVYTGGLENLELDIIGVIDANNFLVWNVMEVLPLVGDEVKIAYYRTPQFDVAGNMVVSNGPLQFNLDGTPVEVSEDNAFPINNIPLPSGMYIKKEGVNVPVSDSATPSEVVAVPVKIMAVGGTDINITAGDLNVQLSDMGPNFDASRIGDGSGNYAGVTADAELKVTDAKALAELEIISAVDFATEGKQDATITALGEILTELELKANLDEDQPVSVASLPLPAGAATEAKQDVGNTSLATIAGKDFATQVTLAAQAPLFGAVTEVAPATDTASSGLNGRLQRIAQRLTSLIGLLPVSLGQKANAASLAVTLSTEQQQLLTDAKNFLDLINGSVGSRVLDSVDNVVTTDPSVPAPGGAKGFIIQNSTQANGALRFTGSGGGASATVGYYLGVGQSTSYIDGSSDLAIFDVDGLGIDAAIIWFT